MDEDQLSRRLPCLIICFLHNIIELPQQHLFVTSTRG